MMKKCCRCCLDPKGISKIIFEFAPEPTDVYWEHLDVTDIKRILKTIGTYIASLILVGICFGIIYGLTIAKNNYTTDHAEDKSKKSEVYT